MIDPITPSVDVLMTRLAGQASSDAIRIRGLNYPDRWDILKIFFGSFGPPNPRAQGFLAKGNSDPDDPTSKEIAVLALGIKWPEFLAYYQSIESVQLPLPSSITGEPQNNNLTLEGVFLNSYNNIRAPLWSAIDKFLGGLDLYICGIGLGAPLAQLAALDLRPSATHRGPGGERPPQKQAPCYAFSVPNVANTALQTYYNDTVLKDGELSTDTYWARKPSLVVDFFPSAPVNSNANIIGNPISINDVTLPPVDVPWLERGNTFYIKQLGGTLAVGPDLKANAILSTGFNQVLAHTCAQCVVAAYSQTQHELGSVPSYSLVAHVNSNSSPFAYIFSNTFNVIVAFRGTITWEEAFVITSNSTLLIPGVIVGGSAGVNTGISDLYNNSPTEKGGSTLFKDALQTAIKSVIGNKKLILTGHDIGGALANLAALDYTLNASIGLTVGQVYTFGAMSLGDTTFKKTFDEQVGNKCYQIRRIYDKISTALVGSPGGYAILDNSVVLDGQLIAEENTYHSINGYMQLLNPG